MEPNEYMENDPVTDTPVPESTPDERSILDEEPAAEAQPLPDEPDVHDAEPVSQTPPISQTESLNQYPPYGGAYRGAGAGQKESPYANSPYYTAYQAQQPGCSGPAWDAGAQNAQQPQYQPPYQSQPKPQKKQRKKLNPKGRKVVAAGLAAALVVGSCSITAALVNNHWEKEVSALEQDMQSQIEALQDKIGGSSSVSGSIAGTTVSAEGYMTPSQLYAANVNSVVSIGNYATVSTGYWGSSSMQMVSTGSGFIISEDGYVVTNYHVAESAEELTVTTYMGDEYVAQLVGYDELNDVALLKVDATGLDAVTIGSSDALAVGDQVVAIGNPLGELTSTQTVGYISGKDRAVSTDGSIINMLQTDAAINSGNSGGPLFNMKGEVIGITTAKYSGDSGSGATIEGIGFAIPIDDVMSMLSDLKEYGYLKNQAYLGVTVRDMDSTVASMYSLPSGSYVDSVTPGSSADNAGVKEKDIIIGLGEYDVGSNAELTTALRKFKAGDTTTITVFRSGQELELTITFDEKPQETTTEETQPSSEQYPGGYSDGYPDGSENPFSDFFPFG